MNAVATPFANPRSKDTFEIVKMVLIATVTIALMAVAILS